MRADARHRQIDNRAVHRHDETTDRNLNRVALFAPTRFEVQLFYRD
jgi:hypothetical protein